MDTKSLFRCSASDIAAKVSSFGILISMEVLFPTDFMFELLYQEFMSLRSQFGISNRGGTRYLYLSQIVCDTESDDKKKNLVKTIKNDSPVTWQHINLHGEYDFSDEILRDSFDFRLPELLDLNVS